MGWRRDRLPTPVFWGFPCGLAGKESACNVWDLGWIPGLGRCPREGKGYPLQYSRLENSMEPQRVGHNWATSLQDPLEKGKGTHSSILAWRIPWNCQELDTTEWLSSHFTSMPLHSVNITFIYAGKPKNSYNFTLLQYALYCHGLELNLQHLPGVCAWTVFRNANLKSSN